MSKREVPQAQEGGRVGARQRLRELLHEKRVATQLGGLSVRATGWEAACKGRGKTHTARVEEREAAM